MQQARENLLKENLKPQYTFTVGSPITEILLNVKDKIENSKILEEKNLSAGDYFVWSSHREENIDNDKNFSNMTESINELAKYGKKILFSVHSRTRKKIEKEKALEILSNRISNFMF